MANILILETSTTQCSVALSRDGEAVAWKEDRSKNGYVHAERLMPLVDEILGEQGWAKTELDAVAVSGGPGSLPAFALVLLPRKGFVMDSTFR